MKLSHRLNSWRSRAKTAALIGAAAAISLHAGGAFAQATQAFPPADRIVVIGDVHGAYGAMVGILKATGVTDADGNWTGGDTHLVSLGDLLDRGADSRAAMDLIIRLQQSAPEAGGRVHMVLGNHEHMNMIGDLRYVAPGEYAAFAADETESMREEAFSTWIAEQPDPAAATREQFDNRYPAGYFAHRAAFSPEGRYGEWLLGLPAIVVIGDTAFAHGGLSSTIAELGLEGTNHGLRDELVEYLSLRESLAAAGALAALDMQNDLTVAQQMLAAAESPTDDSAAAADENTKAPESRAPPPPGMERFFAIGTDGIGTATDSPLWYRGSVYCKPLLERPVLDAALASLSAARVVVGHTPTDNRRAQVRHDGRLVMLDTGMLASYYNGTASAMIIEGERISVQYQGDTTPTPLETNRNQETYGLTVAELADALRSGEIVSVSAVPEGFESHVVLNFGGTELKALFVPHEQGGTFELAAARIDDLIGSQMIAPTVAREIEGTMGALQLVYADSVSEAERLAARRGFSGFCPLEPQLHLMYTIDALIANEGRSTSNILFADDVSELLLTGHTRAFGTSRSLAAGLDPAVLQIPPAVVEGLSSLDEESLEAGLDGLLDRRRIRALLSRRDQLIEGR